MRNIFKFLKPFWTGIILSTIAMAVTTICDLLLPTVMSEILNRGIYGKDYAYIISCCGIMLAIALVGLASTLIGSKISCDVVASFCGDLRNAVFRKVEHMTLQQFSSIGTAALVTRTSHDVQTLSWIAAELTGTVITIPVLFFGGFFLTMRKDLTIALLLLAFMPVIFAVVIFIGRKILPLWDKSDEYIDKQNDLMRQRLRGIRVIRAFNAEHIEHEKIDKATRLMADYIIKGNVAMGLITPLATFLLNLAIIIVLYLGGYKIEAGAGLTGGDIFAIVQYIGLITSAVIMGSFTIIMFPHAKVASKRIGQVFDMPEAEEKTAKNDQSLSGMIELQDVSFCYDGATEPALRNINMQIPAGSKIAIIGGTGAGKSTVVSLLLGFRTPTSGKVIFDNIPFEELGASTVRKHISCALQNATLYSGTIGENVRMGKLDATDEEVWSALKDAQAEHFVREFEDGLEHAIKQSGKNVSGGQKQRLNIARALIKDAPIYIFDDSFSALDFMTEAKLRLALKERISGKTQILITQRVSSAMSADCIFVMDKGTVVDTGTHQQLLERCDVYREIYVSQTGGAL